MDTAPETESRSRRDTYPLTLLGIFSVLWIWLAIDPLFREDWLLENLLVMAAVPGLVLAWRRWPFSHLTYTCLFVFLVFHEIGSHYTYSLVPYDAWWQAVTGHSLNDWLGFERNHYDRLVHFLYGLLVTPAAVELFAHYGRYPRTWAFLFPLLFVTSHSVIYELVEWAAAASFGGELGVAYLGTQGDVWDAQKDMALALSGALITLTVMAAMGRLPTRR
jgi:putative membrane protein